MRIISLLTLFVLGGCSAPIPQDTKSIDGAQHAFFPDRYDYGVGDFVLSLPIGYYEATSQRLLFAQKIINTGSPKPVLEQRKYLVLEADGLAPQRHYLLLDQRHLLIYSEKMSLDGGYPSSLEVLRRIGDAAWEDVSTSVVPQWARSPSNVVFSADRSKITVTSKEGDSRTLLWKSGKLEPDS